MTAPTHDGIIPVLEHELKHVNRLLDTEVGFRERSVLNLASKNLIAAAGSGTTIALAFTSNVASGATLAASATCGSGTATCTFSDSQSNTWVTAQTITDIDNGLRCYSGYAKNAAAGATTVTATFSIAGDFRCITIHEVSGADTTAPLDGNSGQFQAAAIGTATDGISSTNLTTTANGCYIFGSTYTYNADNAIAAGTGYTGRESVDIASNLFTLQSEDKIQAVAGATAATFTSGFDNNTALTVALAFKPAAAGGTTHPGWSGNFGGWF